ncbi:hypothetical protein [Brevibacillus laterosporus]|uniref:hypothetical protein n=1 Tax=Brevibacillus laterosporus TaxID=1465 RepID=UPI00265144A8|nr:hypothetical protein [Brevibacillus laterosporus]MDN9012459.1 hypothetical protein [Brevibacillus laterosporus]MDO0943478.1 hypothetical protein [Brevibacillus laterosporus]
MDQPIKITKMDEKLSACFEEGFTIISDITVRQGDIRTVILRWPNDKAKYTVLLLKSYKLVDIEEISEIILSKNDVEILSAYFNS